ncbi:MAG: undecaprenyl-diphosphate phosphatase [Eubacteriales bacterium]|jgi:undecaprenyl-diphosphatase|nr:undecaprenyl-diphosphate phosphatase [Eubacteriales bacterium]
MSHLEAVFYGIVQGLTEFLPISSSGHLSILQHVFGTADLETSYFTFDILLHLATLAAVFVVYWRDILPLVPAFFTMTGKLFRGKFRLAEFDTNERFVIFIIIATLPLIGAVFIKDYVEILYGSVKIIGLLLILNGIILFVSDILSHGNKTTDETKPHNALIVGLCQMCAVLPGLSRSGSTITGGLTQGFSREYAVKFSFILSIPAILGANILEIPTLLSTPVPKSDITAYMAGMAAAALAGVAAMKLLIYISRRASFKIFSVYCITVGLLTFIFA